MDLRRSNILGLRMLDVALDPSPACAWFETAVMLSSSFHSVAPTAGSADEGGDDTGELDISGCDALSDPCSLFAVYLIFKERNANKRNINQVSFFVKTCAIYFRPFIFFRLILLWTIHRFPIHSFLNPSQPAHLPVS